MTFITITEHPTYGVQCHCTEDIKEFELTLLTALQYPITIKTATINEPKHINSRIDVEKFIDSLKKD
jgi:hypothetical protein